MRQCGVECGQPGFKSSLLLCKLARWPWACNTLSARSSSLGYWCYILWVPWGEKWDITKCLQNANAMYCTEKFPIHNTGKEWKRYKQTLKFLEWKQKTKDTSSVILDSQKERTMRNAEIKARKRCLSDSGRATHLLHNMSNHKKCFQ